MQPSQPAAPGRILPSLVTFLQAAILIAATVLAVDGFVSLATRILRRSHWLDFQVYYLSARLSELAGPVYSVPSRTALGASLDLTPMVYNYPPFFTALLRPFANLPFQLAGTIWMLMGLGFLALSVFILSRTLFLSLWKIVIIGLIALLMPATASTLDLGQSSLFLTLLFVAALAVAPLTDEFPNSLVAGLLLGIAAGMKIYPVLLAVPFFIQRRVKTLLVMASTILGTVIVGILYGGGIGDTWAYWTDVFPAVSGLNLYPPNQSARAAIQRLFEVYPMQTTLRGKDVTINLIPLVVAPEIGKILGIVVVVLIFGVSLWIMYRRTHLLQGRDVLIYNFALMIPATLLIIPLTWDHYATHLILPLAVVGLYKPAKPLPRLLFALSVLLLVLHKYWVTSLFQTPYAWLVMSGFLGTLCLWLALLWNPEPASIPVRENVRREPLSTQYNTN